MKEKIKWITTYVILGALLAGVAVNSWNGVRTVNMVSALNETIQEQKEPEGTVEDGVVIAGEYVIESTVQISDAYKSGDTSALSDRDKETLDMASEVLEEIITEDMTDYEKELAVYEWMTGELVFDGGSLVVIPTSQADCDNPYGVLKNHNAVCVGFATTFRLFMQMMDIECMVVHNTEEYHSWNLVKLDDEWYHTDIYSDAGTTSYANFNMNDSMCMQGHDWDTTFFPAATGIQYNRGYQNRESLSDIYELPAFISEMMEADESTCCFVEFEDDMDTTEFLLADAMVSMIEERLWQLEEYAFTEFSYSWVPNGEDNYYLSLCVAKYNSEEGGINIDDEDYARIQEAVDEYFPEFDYSYWDDDYYGDDDFYLGDDSYWDDNYYIEPDNGILFGE